MAQKGYCLMALGRVQEGVSVYREALEAKTAEGDASVPNATDLRRLLADAERRQMSGEPE